MFTPVFIMCVTKYLNSSGVQLCVKIVFIPLKQNSAVVLSSNEVVRQETSCFFSLSISEEHKVM